MVLRITAEEFIGRAAELAAIRAATTAAAGGESRIVTVSGDAGIGKSRLIARACEQARADGMLAVAGGCVQLGGETSLAFAPLVEALREIRRTVGEAEFGELTGGLTDVAALLGGAGPAQPPGSATVFEQVLGLLARLAARQPTLLVFEDLHWADPATRDLLSFLARNLRDTAVAVVLTYRADEVGRQHPLRPVLGELERSAGVERLSLGGFDREQLAALLTGLGATADPPVVDRLLARTGGNPFYVEELVATSDPGGDLGAGLPEVVSQVILARVSRLCGPARAVIGKASALGGVIDEEVLTAICDGQADEVTDAIRAAVDQHLVVIGRDGVSFRHALVREALYEDLLPGERTRLHRAAAAAIEAKTPQSRGVTAYLHWAQLAHHWTAAKDPDKAFAASMRAGLAADDGHAHADAATHFEQALRLWDAAGDPEAVAGMDRAELLYRAADDAHYSSLSPRGLRLIESAYEALPEDASPERRAVLLERVGRMRWINGLGGEAVEAYERAVALLDGQPTSREQALVTAALGQCLMLRGNNVAAEKVLREAADAAAVAGALDVAAHTQCSLGVVEAELGRPADGAATVEQAMQLSREHGTPGDVARGYTNLVPLLCWAGRYDDAVQAARDGLAHCDETGHRAHMGHFVAGELVLILTSTGRWAEADEVHARMAATLDRASPFLELAWLRLLTWSGRLEQAAGVAERVLAATAQSYDVQFEAGALIRAGELAAAQRQWDQARARFAEALEVVARAEEQYYTAYAIAAAMAAEADRVDAAVGGERAAAEIAEARTVADQLADHARGLAARVGDDLTALLPEPAGWLAAAEADHARAWGRDTAAQWWGVAERWDSVGMPYPAALARFRQADAELRRNGDRGAAATVAERALRTAEELGAEPLAGELRRLAQRGRLNLDRAEPAPELAGGLDITARQAEVLALLAVGRTNRQIAETLFISEKTASVHVTHLLRRLGVANRVEAAAVAQRLGY